MKEANYFVAILLLITINACTQPAQIKNPPGYQLDKPEVFTMPAGLHEISGITFKNGNADTVYAQQDEEGKIFMLKPGDKDARVVKFGKKGDYEDLAVINDTVIMLKSNGSVLMFSLKEVSGESAANLTEISGKVPAGEYESLYAHATNGLLYILCKSCAGNKKEGLVKGYILNRYQAIDSTVAEFSINETEIETLAGVKKITFKPSAITRNLQTNEWYILSSVNKMLVVADDAWKVKNVYPLQPASVFTQPEGMAFDSNNNLYIANESGGVGNGTILKFAYTKQ